MTNFSEMTNEQINRWAADRDGLKIVRSGDKGTWSVKTNAVNLGGGYLTKSAAMDSLARLLTYPTSSDSALALLGRWGYRIKCLREYRNGEFKNPYHIELQPLDSETVFVSQGPTLERAALNAACSLKEAMEAKSDD